MWSAKFVCYCPGVYKCSSAGKGTAKADLDKAARRVTSVSEVPGLEYIEDILCFENLANFVV